MDIEGSSARMVALSVESGILCPVTAFVGFTESRYSPWWGRSRYDCCAGGSCSQPKIVDFADAEPIKAPQVQMAKPQEILRGVVDLQQFDGSWNDAQKLCSLVQRKVNEFPEVKASDAFATIVALAILRAKCQ
jgi:hypothetical protein